MYHEMDKGYIVVKDDKPINKIIYNKRGDAIERMLRFMPPEYYSPMTPADRKSILGKLRRQGYSVKYATLSLMIH